MNYTIDLNADLGEGKTNDEALLKYLSSCNIACGGHIGDQQSILKTIKLAQKHKVKIGAHPSYPDVENFGRKSIKISIDDLVEAIDNQLNLFKKCIDETKATWHHIKFHGALYNDLKSDETKARALVNLIKDKHQKTILYVPPNSMIQSVAKPQIPIKIEGFADRAYNEDLSLVSRQHPKAVFKTSEAVIKQVKKMIIDKVVETFNSKHISIKVDTICIHGDTPKALDMLETLVDELKNQKIKIQ
ncbi:5-oxoprolinase subunit PxpA [Flavobacterium sp. CS20]|jgi:UPF0271 protein|uniref:5-oxoprolinase subunit PxpA n=1 Tax=Flavobacterium sp. CS20 TaxID=2775246 RepID=UPI001B3A0679|nr:5-oxoprolinase subunit PxpA [Flavobacterium sp. CS20]QTY27242.1 5-oxoprolinase subunit PxpA [Flavobacterium sp. CS20]